MRYQWIAGKTERRALKTGYNQTGLLICWEKLENMADAGSLSLSEAWRTSMLIEWLVLDSVLLLIGT
jgi:hypothetical protein